MSSPSSPSDSHGSTSPERKPRVEDDEVNLLDVAIFLAKNKRLIFGLPLIASIVAAGIALLQPDIYTATARIIPPQQNSTSGLGILSQQGGLTGIKTQSDLYIGMLKSRTVADNLIQRFGLTQIYQYKYLSQVRFALAGATNIVVGKDGIVAIEVDDKDPKFAAELANAYVEELLKLTTVLAVTEASQRRLFFERQFQQARDNLLKAETAARQAMERGGLVQVEGQGRAMVEATGRLRGQISAKEVQIGGMRTYAAERNPEIQYAQRELEVLKQELAKMEGATGSKLDAPGGNSSRGFDSLRILRDVKYYETIYESLAKQFELAKIDEAKESAVVQVLDRAIEPDRKSKPNKTNFVIFAAIGALFIAVVWALFREAILKSVKDPEQAARLEALKRSLHPRRKRL